jgi:tetratricopeptide (TPR) repeat protein
MSCRYRAMMLAAVLFLAVSALYVKSVSFDFINLDDIDYVVKNEVVSPGFTVQGIKRAFTETHLKLWSPATWLSYMADAEFYSMEAGGFHLTNTLLHALNTLLFFAFLYLATGSLWKSFFAAALWAFHPLRVESVAWITERKDLLSGFFFLLCLLAYLGYAKSKKPLWHLAALFMMLLGYWSKPILVVMPAILLAVDLWPLERFTGERENLKGLLREKVPFVALSLVLVPLTLLFQKGAIGAWEEVSWGSRFVNVATSYLYYLYRTFWPVDLVMSDINTAARFTGVWLAPAVLATLGITVLCWKTRKTFPFLFAGWFWYLCALLPVSGIIPAGTYLVADHFTYLPHMGVVIVLVWGAAALTEEKALLRKAAAWFALAALALLGYLSFNQLSHWKDGVTLFSHNLSVTGGDSFNEKLLWNAYLSRDEPEKALALIDESLKVRPLYPSTWLAKGSYFENSKRYREAIDCYKEALRLKPDYLEAHYRLADSAIWLGDFDLARYHLDKSLALDPSHYQSLNLAGYIYNETGKFPQAVEVLIKSLEINPYNHEAHFNLSVALDALGRHEEAIREIEAALALSPEHIPSLRNAGIYYSKAGNKDKALEYLFKAANLDAKSAEVHSDLGIALAEAGRAQEAVGHFEKAVNLKPEDPANNLNLALALLASGQFDRAEAFFEKTLRIDPSSGSALFNYGLLLEKTGRTQEARRLFREVLKQYPGQEEVRKALLRIGEGGR